MSEGVYCWLFLVDLESLGRREFFCLRLLVPHAASLISISAPKAHIFYLKSISFSLSTIAGSRSKIP